MTEIFRLSLIQILHTNNMLHISRLDLGSSPELGSSNINISESPINDIPKDIFRLTPPDKTLGRLSASDVNCSKSKYLLVSFLASLNDLPFNFKNQNNLFENFSHNLSYMGKFSENLKYYSF